MAQHTVDYDLAQGGATFEDPDGDPLTYQVQWETGAGPSGLRFDGTHITGATTDTGLFSAVIGASDGHGDSFTLDTVRIDVVPNGAPEVANANLPQLVSVGVELNYDVTQTGTTFLEPDGDPMTYAISFANAPLGLLTGVESWPSRRPSVIMRDCGNPKSLNEKLLFRPGLRSTPIWPKIWSNMGAGLQRYGSDASSKSQVRVAIRLISARRPRHEKVDL